MEKKDILLKEYLQDEEHFCDFINGVLFKGKTLLAEGQIEELPTELVFTKELSKENTREEPQIKTLHRFRDLTKKCHINGEEVIIAVQNQSKVDFNMAVRIMTEDALDYSMQCKAKKGGRLHKGELLTRVISIVFYHGAAKWTAPLNIASQLKKLPAGMEELERYAQQNEILLITPWNVDVSKLTGGWREIFEILKRQNKEETMKEYLQEHKEQYRNLPEDTKRLTFALVGKLNYYEELKKKGCEADLCKAFEDHYKSGERHGRRLGRREGRTLGRREGMAHGIYCMIRENQELGVCTEEIVKKIQRYFGIGEKESREYMDQYAEYNFNLAKMI